MIESTRRGFLVGIGALAAVLAVPRPVAAAVEAVAPPLRSYWMVSEITENSTYYTLRLVQMMHKPDGLFWEIRTSETDRIDIQHHIRALFSMCGPAAFAVERVTVDLTIGPDIGQLRPGVMVDLILDDVPRHGMSLEHHR